MIHIRDNNPLYLLVTIKYRLEYDNISFIASGAFFLSLKIIKL